ncbi:MAG: sigma-70 family RNA polymerase sigma factor [Ruminiclostridium sp.]|nr:sigma-70 family RNA polymerase sigma factor [Ruminiclostridium sp.]
MNEEKLAEYVCLYRGTVFRLAYSYLKNREDAEDISQEAFLRLYKSKESFKSDENVKAWLIRVTINLSRNLLKSGWRKRRTELEKEFPFSQKEENDLHYFISRLKPEYSVVIHLFYYEGYSIKEISEICRISSAAVRTRLTRARNQLKEMLLKEGF